MKGGLTIILATSVAIMTGASPSAADQVFPENKNWQAELKKVYTGQCFDDVTNIALPVASTLGYSTAVASGDLNGDGLQDLIVGQMYGQIRIFISRGPDKRFADDTLQRIAVEMIYPEDIVVVDLNQDGDADILLGDRGKGGLKVYENQGAGRFERAATDFATVRPFALGILSLNDDEFPDVVVGTGDGLTFLINRGGHLADFKRPFPAEAFLSQVADLKVVDLNFDGLSDIVTVGDGGNYVFFATKDGEFRIEPLNANEPDQESWSIDVSDVNGDGWFDILVGNVLFKNPDADLRKRLYMGQAGGEEFVEESGKRLPPDDDVVHEARFLDLDGDGALDIVSSTFMGDTWGRWQSGMFKTYMNDGYGFFAQSSDAFPRSVTGSGRALVAGPLWGDGTMDIYLANRGGADLLLRGKASCDKGGGDE